jgi:hypothetical protein
MQNNIYSHYRNEKSCVGSKYLYNSFECLKNFEVQTFLIVLLITHREYSGVRES